MCYRYESECEKCCAPDPTFVYCKDCYVKLVDKIEQLHTRLMDAEKALGDEYAGGFGDPTVEYYCKYPIPEDAELTKG